MRKLRTLRSSGQSFYASIRWDVLLLLGGAANFLAIRAFQDYYQFVTSFQYIYGTSESFPPSITYIAKVSLIPLILLFVFPILLSMVLTRLMPDKRIISPLYIQMVTLSGIVIFSFSGTLFAADVLPTLLLGFTYTVIGGVIQDRATSALFGVSSERENIVTSSLEVLNASPNDVVRIISTPKFSDNLAVVSPPQKINGSFVFRNPRGYKYDIRIEVMTMPNGESTLVNLAFFQKSRYYLHYSDELAEYARATHVYLRDLLARASSISDPKVNLMVQEPVEKHAAILVDSIIDETQGLWVQTQKLNKIGWAKLALFIVALGIVGVFVFQLKDYASAYATIALIILYLVFEVPSRLRRD